MNHCDPTTGICSLPDDTIILAQSVALTESKATIHYFGDPMCSWCWGISPAVHEAQKYAHTNGLRFEMTMGGLRIGGGDPWNEEFRNFLRKEWGHIHEKTGQPMSYKILDKASFNYDTEPPSRAFALAQSMLETGKISEQQLLNFYTAIQRTFYVDGLDPASIDFYQNACAEAGIDFAALAESFDTQAAHDLVKTQFMRARQWGVRSFPTILLQTSETLTTLAVGYVSAQDLHRRLDAQLEAH